ncbi:MAG: DNA recombination protein RmuC [Bacteroidota bacterium]|nr:DNA recombination protein RmuC [Bacteroidota bacterium]MDP4252051.1 DNA recombination protein RmuC [Bacteroidota bacterium]
MLTSALIISIVFALLSFCAGWLFAAFRGKPALMKEAGERIRIQTQYEKALQDLNALNREMLNLKDAEAQWRLREMATGNSLASVNAKYEEALKAVKEQKEFVLEAQQTLKDAFHSMSATALDKNNRSFLDLAKTALTNHISETKNDLDKRQQAIDSLVKPLGASLEKMDEKISQLEMKREGAYGHLNGLLDQMRMTTQALDKETRNLVSALKTSHTRGRYGEIALRRLVEFSGMLDQCDFTEQQSVDGENGRLRPDMIIRLPGNRTVVVDSKVPLSAYLQIFETDDALLQKQLLTEHVLAIKTHLRQLSAKAYWDQFDEAPDFVVLFMQIESSFGAALQAWPGLIEEALNNRIIVATPTTLITILRSVGYSWNQLKTMENIETIREAAVELYERSANLMEHIAHIGKGLQGTLSHYNKAVGSLESQFLPQARRIQQLSQAYVKKNLPDLPPVETMVRELPANE